MTRVEMRSHTVRRVDPTPSKVTPKVAKVEPQKVDTTPKVEFFKTSQTTGPTTAALEKTFTANYMQTKVQSSGLLRDTKFDAIDTKLQTTKAEFDSAKSTVDGHNKKLNQQLGRLGPGLTEEQKKAYIAKFREENKADYERFDAATTKLTETLQEASKLPNMPPATTIRALEAANALAETPEGAKGAKDFAVSVAKKLETNPGYFTGGLNNLTASQAEDSLNDIVSKAVPNIYANELRAADGDATKAGNALAAELEGVDRLRVFKSSAEPIKKGIEALKTSNFDALKSLDQDNRFGKSFQVAGVALGIAKLASGADLAATDYLQTIAATGKDGAELIARGMKAMAASSRVSAGVSVGLQAGASWATRIAPGLGIAANALQTSIDAMKLMSKDGNRGDALAVVGDSLATVGAVLALTVVGAPAAIPLQVVGTVIGKVGNMWSDSINREQDIAEQKQRLQSIGLDEPAAEQLSRADPAALQVLSSKYPPEELRALLLRNPNSFTSEYAAREFLAISQRRAGYPWARGG